MVFNFNSLTIFLTLRIFYSLNTKFVLFQNNLIVMLENFVNPFSSYELTSESSNAFIYLIYFQDEPMK